MHEDTAAKMITIAGDQLEEELSNRVSAEIIANFKARVDKKIKEKTKNISYEMSQNMIERLARSTILQTVKNLIEADFFSLDEVMSIIRISLRKVKSIAQSNTQIKKCEK